MKYLRKAVALRSDVALFFYTDQVAQVGELNKRSKKVLITHWKNTNFPIL